MIVEYNYEKTVYSNILAPKIPKLVIKNLLGTKQKNLNVLLDTGYDGYLVIPEGIYEDLEFHTFEIIEDEIPLVETFTGEKFTLRTASILVEIKDLLDETIIEVDTTPYCKEPLIGRQFLELFIAVLDGRNNILKIEYPENNE